MDKLKYVVVGFILGVLFYACDDWVLMADYDDDGSAIRGSVEWKPLYVYIVNNTGE